MDYLIQVLITDTGRVANTKPGQRYYIIRIEI